MAPPKVREWLRPEWRKWNGGYYKTGRYISILPLWYFSVCYRKAYVTHKKHLDRELESQYALIEKHIEWLNNQGIGNKKWYGDKEFYRQNKRQLKSRNRLELRNALIKGNLEELDFCSYKQLSIW